MSETKKNEIREKLTGVRQELLTFLKGLSEDQWGTTVFAEDQEWTITDLLRHVVQAEADMTGLMKQYQRGEDPVPPDFDLERWNARTIRKRQEETPAELMDHLKENRAELFEFIDTIQPEDWKKKGRHGSLRILTIEEVCHLIADHEKSHLEQMQTAVAA